MTFYNIHYLIVVKSYRKDNLSQASEPTPPVQYTARNAQVFIITRPTPFSEENVYDMAGTQSGLPPPPIYFSNISDIQGAHHNNPISFRGIEPLPPYYNNSKT